MAKSLAFVVDGEGVVCYASVSDDAARLLNTEPIEACLQLVKYVADLTDDRTGQAHALGPALRLWFKTSEVNTKIASKGYEKFNHG